MIVVLALEYSGSHGVHQYDITDLNRIGSGGVYMGYVDPAVKINPQYSHINYRGARGSAPTTRSIPRLAPQIS